MKSLIRYSAILLTCFALLGFTNLSYAAAKSPIGVWTTISDKTNKPRSVVRIYESKGILYGKILKVYKEPGDHNTCINCPGNFKNKPIVGLRFMYGLKPDGRNEWSGGHILDPKPGKIYKCKITLLPDGKTLKVRGYIGFSLLGRTQTWHRTR